MFHGHKQNKQTKTKNKKPVTDKQGNTKGEDFKINCLPHVSPPYKN